MPKLCQTRKCLIINNSMKRTVHFRTLMMSENGHFSSFCLNERLLETNVGLQLLDGLWRKLLEQFKIIKAFQRTVQATVVENGTGLIEIDVRVAT